MDLTEAINGWIERAFGGLAQWRFSRTAPRWFGELG